MPHDELKPKDRVVLRMTRDGAVEENLTEGTSEKVSKRLEDAQLVAPHDAETGDLTEEVRVVHNGGEKVDRFDDSDLIGDAVNGSVVAAVIADQKRRIRHVRQICKNFRQGTRPQLGGSTRRLCHLRETQLVVHGAHLLQKAAFIVEKCEAFVNSGV